MFYKTSPKWSIQKSKEIIKNTVIQVFIFNIVVMFKKYEFVLHLCPIMPFRVKKNLCVLMCLIWFKKKLIIKRHYNKVFGKGYSKHQTTSLEKMPLKPAGHCLL